MKKKVISVILWFAAIIGCFLLQRNFQRMVPIVTVAPNLMLIVCFSFGFLRGRNTGMVTGLICGLMMDAFSGRVLGYYTLIFVYIGYLSGMLSRTLMKDVILLPILLCMAAELLYGLYMFVFSYLLYGHTEFGRFVTVMFIPELVITVLMSFVIYGIIMAADHLLRA